MPIETITVPRPVPKRGMYYRKKFKGLLFCVKYMIDAYFEPPDLKVPNWMGNVKFEILVSERK